MPDTPRGAGTQRVPMRAGTLARATLVLFAGVSGCGGAVETPSIRRGPFRLDSAGVTITLPEPYELRDRPTQLCVGVDTAQYILNDRRGWTVRRRGPGTAGSVGVAADSQGGADGSGAALTGAVVTAAGRRVELRASGYIQAIGGGQLVCMSSLDSRPGTKVTAVELRASRAVTADSVLWWVVVR